MSNGYRIGNFHLPMWVPSLLLTFKLSWQCIELGRSQRQHKQEQQKISTDFQRALESFQSVSRRSAEKQRQFVQKAKRTVEAIDSGAISPGVVEWVNITGRSRVSEVARSVDTVKTDSSFSCTALPELANFSSCRSLTLSLLKR